MIFYMIEDLNSGKWYKRGSCGGNWVAKDQASVWTTKAGPSACLGGISCYNRWLAHRKSTRLPREPEIRTIDTEGNGAMEALLELVAVYKLLKNETNNVGLEERWNFALASAEQVIAIAMRNDLNMTFEDPPK
jgi:hypothetical protein